MDYIMKDMWLIVLILTIGIYKGWKIYLCAKYDKKSEDLND